MVTKVSLQVFVCLHLLNFAVWSRLTFSIPQLQNFRSFASRLPKRNVTVTTILNILKYLKLNVLQLRFQLRYCVLSMFRIYCGVSCHGKGSTLRLRSIQPLYSRNVVVHVTSGFHLLNPTFERTRTFASRTCSPKPLSLKSITPI